MVREGARAPVYPEARQPPGPAGPRPGSVPVPAQSPGSTYFAAMDFAVSESGPGCGTKTASR